MDNNPTVSRFCWRPAWSSRFESLWSMMRRFAFFNEATAKNLQDAFGTGPVASYCWASRKRGDLRSYGGLDPPLLARVFGVDRETLDESTVAPFIAQGEQDILTSGDLRFCHSCLKDDFHSSLHQILLVRECPLHREPLVDRCSHCDTRVDYTLKTAPISSGTGCPECVGRSGTDTEIRKKFSVVSKRREGEFLAETGFLLRRRQLQIPGGAASTEWIAAGKAANARERRLSSLRRYWEQVVNGNAGIGTTPPNESYACFQYRAKQSIATNMNSEGGGRYHHDLDAELILILKSIRRQLERHWLGSHGKCAFSLASRERLAMRIQDGKRCPYANVLILWRLYWEDFDELHYLLRPYRKRINHGTERPVNWRPVPSYLPRELVHRLFALECLGVLEQCYVLVRTMRRLNRHTFYPGFLQKGGKCMPYWIIERTGDKEFRLHVWKTLRPRKSWSQFKFPESSKLSHALECAVFPSIRIPERIPHLLRDELGRYWV